MPRPANGYSNAAGETIAGTHDPINRYMDKQALIGWAYKRGKAGQELYDRNALDIGSTVHGMAELDLKGSPDRLITAYCHDRLATPDALKKAWHCFEAFRKWRQECHVRAVAQECVLISERHQFGGTPDTIAVVANGLGLLDFKSMSTIPARPYNDQLLALAAHGLLWEENHPNEPLQSYHLIGLGKNGEGFRHWAYSDLSDYRKLFLMQLASYRAEKAAQPTLLGETPRQARTDEKTVASVDRPIPITVNLSTSLAAAANKARAEDAKLVNGDGLDIPGFLKRKPRVRVKAKSQPVYASLGEMLRAYKHVAG